MCQTTPNRSHTSTHRCKYTKDRERDRGREVQGEGEKLGSQLANTLQLSPTSLFLVCSCFPSPHPTMAPKHNFQTLVRRKRIWTSKVMTLHCKESLLKTIMFHNYTHADMTHRGVYVSVPCDVQRRGLFF